MPTTGGEAGGGADGASAEAGHGPARMHLADDHVHPTPGRGRCRVRIFVPNEEGERLGDRHVIVCSEMAENGGEGVTRAAEQIYESVTEAFRLINPIWLEHHPPETTDGSTETVELVVFSPDSKPTWKPLDRAAVEALVGRAL